jgi:hypothetical protein
METGQPYAYTGDDPVDMTDPSGLLDLNPITDLEKLGEDAGEAIGSVLEAPVTIAAAIGGAIAVAWSAATATKAGGTAEIPILFGQSRISECSQNGEWIAGPSSGQPIPVFPWQVGGKPVAVAIGNRRLANYALNGVTHPPFVWQTPTSSELSRLGEGSAAGGSLPSPNILVTTSQSNLTPVNVPGSKSGVVTSKSFIRLEY